MNYDIIVIGAGPAGYNCAIKFAKQGKKVAVIEKNSLGGTCLNCGCIPTKFLWQAAKTKQKISKSLEYGIKANIENITFADIIAKKNRLVENLVKGVERLLKTSNVEIIKGEAGFKDKNTITVKNSDGEIELQADKIVIATGSDCKAIPNTEFDHQKYISSTDALNMTELPKSMLVIGGGAIGIELSSIFSAFGVNVTLREICPQLLPSEDTELATELAKVMARQGIKVEVACTEPLKDADKFDKILIAAGRKSVTDILKIENINLGLDKKNFIETKNYSTNIDNIFAIGDASGKGFLAYTAEQDAENLVFGTQSSNPVPKVVFSFPPAASVKAVDFDNYKNIVYTKTNYSSNARAQIEGERTGWIKVAFDKDSGKILGVWILGANADEMINTASVMIKAGMKASDIKREMFFHPGLSEILFETINNL